MANCVGALEPLNHINPWSKMSGDTIAAALEDYRFPQVSESELKDIEIEISRLTLPQQLIYKDPDNLLSKTPSRYQSGDNPAIGCAAPPFYPRCGTRYLKRNPFWKTCVIKWELPPTCGGSNT